MSRLCVLRVVMTVTVLCGFGLRVGIAGMIGSLHTIRDIGWSGGFGTTLPGLCRVFRPACNN